MNILFFTRLFYPHIGGVEKHVLEISRELVARGHTVTVVTERYSKDLPIRDYLGTIRIFRIPIGNNVWFKKFTIWWWLMRNNQIIRKADVIHCHDVFFWFIPFHFLFPKKPVYTTFHGYEGRYPPSQNAILVRRLSAYLSKGNISVGDYIAKWYGTKADYVTYGGVDTSKSQIAPARNASLPASQAERGGLGASVAGGKLKILFIGRLEKDTGIPIYLSAIKLLKKKKIKFQFEVCGDGILRSKVEEFGNVYGFTNDLGPYLENTDIVFTSSYLSILEALSYGKAVIAVYENPLKKDYLQMAPFADAIVITYSAKAIYENIIRLKNDFKAREKLISVGDNFVRNQSWSRLADMYERLWHI